MRTVSTKQRLLRSTIVGGAALAAVASMAATPVLAQDAEPTENEVEAIVVTGSRIAVRDTTGSSPIVTVSGDALEEIGTGTIETYLNSLPQLSPSLTKTNNNPTAGGAAFLDLRQLGASRGLTLVDGKRLVPGSSSGAVDVSILPSAVIDRVEIITGGASAVYGSDAISGVVNFILKDDFEGVEVSTQYGISDYSDGEEIQHNLLVGGDFDEGRGHITFAASYLDRNAIAQTERPFSVRAERCYVNGCVPNGSPTTGDGSFTLPTINPMAVTGISSANFRTQLANYFVARGVFANQAAALTQLNQSNQRIGFNPDGSLFVAGTAFDSGTGVFGYTGPNAGTNDLSRFFGYNFNPVNLIQSPFERYNFYTNFNYDISDNIEFYGNALYANYSSSNQLAESPAGFAAPATSGFIAADARAAFAAGGVTSFTLSRRTNELGPRTYLFDTEVFQLQGGFRGDLPEFNGNVWTYDVYGTHGEYGQTIEYRGFPERNRINAALGGCPAGSPIGPVGPNGATTSCVPLNPFGANNITAAQRDYIEAKGQFEQIDIVQDNVVAAVSGDIYELPAGFLAFAAGVEFRSIDFSDVPPEGVQTGALLGGNASGPLAGGYDVYELFSELRVPILADLPFVHALTLEGGYRISDYTLDGTKTVETYKYGGEYAPFDWLRFRGLHQKAVRAPSVGELFSTRAEGFPSFSTLADPCSVGSAARMANNAQVVALCNAQAPAVNFTGFVSTGTQLRTFSGGNPNLGPENAETDTYGFVLTAPSWAPGWASSLSLTVDYFDISIENVISAVGAGTSLARCYDPTFNPTFDVNYSLCQNISRDQSNGLLTSTSITGFVSQTNANLAQFIASGVDIGASYRFDWADLGLSDSWGSVSISTQGTWYENQQFESLPGDGFGDNFVGFIGDGTPGSTTLPEWKWSTRFAWTTDDFNVSLRWAYIDEVADGLFNPNDTSAAAIANGGQIPGIDSYNYFYLSGSYNVTDNFELFGGVDNLFDKDPPIYTNGFQYNTDPSTYDVIGRYFYVGAKARF